MFLPALQQKFFLHPRIKWFILENTFQNYVLAILFWNFFSEKMLSKISRKHFLKYTYKFWKGYPKDSVKANPKVI